MSQRDDLLAGARKCLVEKGYQHTTARDIAAVSGSHLASIGYHFGSKDALMNLAALEAQDEWGGRISEAVSASARAEPSDRLRVALDEFLRSLPVHRPLIVASVQAFAQAEFADEIHEALDQRGAEGRDELAAMLLGIDPEEIDMEAAATVGPVAHALILGFSVQSLVSPDAVPTGEQVVAALRKLVDE
ncbi:TetR family transcriptional regulator [Tamaricihabitans halophyticus]|uniref:TetR family transcriptional regulator n=1 Tax=Tamaricihabitans halophyticus TaxID=1262583 RepID=A0A4R2R4D4_9PSEU|nr:TetR/AcrR family transcriptional regulator [Tamaricihabitans halophyticus]TCP56764.1 TetR family transcriptional regulator [Tamaricihabitans halophyticus]